MLKLKICGLKDPENFKEILGLKPDFVGLNFYPSSSRYIGNTEGFERLNSVYLTGIFVNHQLEEIFTLAEKYKLDFVQLHGQESPDFCGEVRLKYPVIKAFQVQEDFDFHVLEEYLDNCDYFLLDATGKAPGGNGKVFNWDILKYYPYQKPFFLAGGLSPKNVETALQLNLPQLYALDVNSGYEVEPGKKDINKLKELKQLIAHV